jgi:hypothetical protein
MSSTPWHYWNEFPDDPGVYEVFSAPGGQKAFYYDGAHWHLYNAALFDRDMRTYGCPGPMWRKMT